MNDADDLIEEHKANIRDIEMATPESNRRVLQRGLDRVNKTRQEMTNDFGGTPVRQPIPKLQSKWCEGCTPDNCAGCVVWAVENEC